MSLIEISEYIAHLNISADEQQRVDKLTESCTTSIEGYLGRKIQRATVDKIYAANFYGELLLDNPPLATIDRVFEDTAGAFSVSNSSASNANVFVSETAVILRATSNGATTPNTLEFTDYATITLLVAAINDLSGWTATVSDGQGGLATSDLVPGQFISATTSNDIYIWEESTDITFTVDFDHSVIRGLRRYERVRIQHTSGWLAAEIPEDIKKALAGCVIRALDSGTGSIGSESLGEYSYSQAAQSAFSSMPSDDLAVINRYRDGG